MAAVDIHYEIKELLELNLAYMPFIKNGGLFVPTNQSYPLGTLVNLQLSIPIKKLDLNIMGRVVWLTPKNTLHQVLPGIGLQFIGSEAENINLKLQSFLNYGNDIGGYTYGITIA